MLAPFARLRSLAALVPPLTSFTVSALGYKSVIIPVFALAGTSILSLHASVVAACNLVVCV